MSLSKTLYLSAPYQTAYSITTDNSDLEKLLRMRYGKYLTDESEDGRQYRSVVISKYRRAFNMQCGEKLYRTRVPLRAFDSYMLKTVEFDDKVIAFHASAVECGGKAYVFLARSGAGIPPAARLRIHNGGLRSDRPRNAPRLSVHRTAPPASRRYHRA